jgi:hypothetical protein
MIDAAIFEGHAILVQRHCNTLHLAKLFRDHSQVVKVSHGIGFRPETHLAGVSKRFVCSLDFIHSIEITNNFVANTFNSKFVLGAPGSDRGVSVWVTRPQ